MANDAKGSWHSSEGATIVPLGPHSREAVSSLASSHSAGSSRHFILRDLDSAKTRIVVLRCRGPETISAVSALQFFVVKKLRDDADFTGAGSLS